MCLLVAWKLSARGKWIVKALYAEMSANCSSLADRAKPVFIAIEFGRNLFENAPVRHSHTKLLDLKRYVCRAMKWNFLCLAAVLEISLISFSSSAGNQWLPRSREREKGSSFYFDPENCRVRRNPEASPTKLAAT